MAGLREIKKENRKSRIFSAALQLFEEVGYERTTMEKIAAGAQLGVGTLYNYFPSKLDILFSIIQSGTGNYVAEMDESLLHCNTLRDSVKALLTIYLKSFSTYSKNVWSELFRESMFRQSALASSIDEIDKPFIERLKTLFGLFQKRGELKSNIDCETAASLLYALLSYHIIRFVANRAMTEKEFTEQLMKEAFLVIENISS